MSTSAIPDGFTSVTAYFSVNDAAKAIDFYVAAFEATELSRYEAPDGRIGHAELQIGNARVMLSDEYPEVGAISPTTLGGTSFAFMLYVEDVDRAFDRAVELGATIERPVDTQFYGDRLGTLLDPFGHRWNVATHVEDVSEEELQRRIKELPQE
ncbi:MAG: VOC family protein [Myxococcales bacterium]|nr:VOC family protein [Myxococcales bacterium]